MPVRKPFAFRPSVADELEDRLVLSRVGLASPAVAPGHLAPTSTQARASRQLDDAFSTFVEEFTLAVNNDLVMPVLNGSATSAGNLPLFNEQIAQELTTLERGALKAAGHVPAGSPVVSQVRQSIIDPGPNGLRGRLNALTTSTVAMGASIPAYENVAIQEIRQTSTRVKQEILASLSSPSTAPPGPASLQSPTIADNGGRRHSR
jgi:hypothetical protein